MTTRRDFLAASVAAINCTNLVWKNNDTHEHDWVDDLFLGTGDADAHAAVSTRDGEWGDPTMWRMERQPGRGGCFQPRHKILVTESSPDVIGCVFWMLRGRNFLEPDFPLQSTRTLQISWCVFFGGLEPVPKPYGNTPFDVQRWRTDKPVKYWEHGYVRPHRDGVPALEGG